MSVDEEISRLGRIDLARAVRAGELTKEQAGALLLERAERTVPPPLRARQALAELPRRLDTRLLFPGPSGGPFDAGNFRNREFTGRERQRGYPRP